MESLKAKRVVLHIESSRAFGQLLAKGIVRYSNYHTRWSLYREAGGIDEKIADVSKWKPDGVIAHVLNAKSARKIIPPGVPAVVKGIQELIPGVCNIVSDTQSTATMAAEHLMGCGFKYFAFCGFRDMLWSQGCEASFIHRMQKEGIHAESYTQKVDQVKRNWHGVLESLSRWLKKLPKPVGIMACNDDRAQHLVEACKMVGLKIPYEVGIIGVDNDEWICTLTSPPLSSIILNTEKLGFEAAELLDRLMAGEPMRDQKVYMRPVSVVVRRSTDIYHLDDPEVLRALEFMKKNFDKPIQVDDIVEATHISRRALYNRFESAIGRSVNGELRRIRIEHLARILVETNLPVSRIVDNCRYTSSRNVARYFKQEKGMSLVDYRKKYGSQI